LGFGFKTQTKFNIHVRVSLHSHAWIMANVKAVRSGFWIQKKNGIVQICESVVSLSRTDRGKCEGGEKWLLGSKNK